MGKRGPTWRAQNRAKHSHIVSRLPGAQITTVDDDLFLVRYSTDDWEEVLEIGRPDKEVVRFKNVRGQREPYMLTIPGIDKTRQEIDAVLDRWAEGQSAADLPGVTVVRSEAVEQAE